MRKVNVQFWLIGTFILLCPQSNMAQMPDSAAAISSVQLEYLLEQYRDPIGCAVASLVYPGFGHFLIGKKTQGAWWLIAGIGANAMLYDRLSRGKVWQQWAFLAFSVNVLSAKAAYEAAREHNREILIGKKSSDTRGFSAEYESLPASGVINKRGVIGVLVSLDGTITNIRSGWPAEESGVMRGDIVLKINGQSPRKFEAGDIYWRLAGEPQTTVELVVRRNNQELQFTVKRRLNDELQSKVKSRQLHK